MAIKQPVKSTTPVFLPSDPTPRLGRALIEASERGDVAWKKRHANDNPELTPPVWFSDAGKCARAISYRLTGVEGVPMDDAGRHVVQLGNVIHDAVQAQWANDEVEVPASITDIDGVTWLAGRMDILAAHGNHTEVIDLKSIGSFGFKKKQTDEGPDLSHVLQVALGMEATGADAGRIVYIAKERMNERDRKSIGLAEDSPRRVAVEFEFTAAEVQELLLPEIQRLYRIWELAVEGKLAPRAIPHVTPTGARITDPEKGAWAVWILDENGNPALEDTGTAWACNYCSFQDVCVSDKRREDAEKLAEKLAAEDLFNYPDDELETPDIAEENDDR